MNIVRVILFPFAIAYGIITEIRNKLFDWGVLPTSSFAHPIIGIGNLSTGGTGKTPHIEYLIRLLIDSYNIATLSRGYKRKTNGFILAGPASTVEEIGDEPLQIHTKFPEIDVAVCEKRALGIRSLLSLKPSNQIILLDDVFQHRYVKPGLNILLTDYHNIFTKGYLLPTGNLRESRKNAKRADVLIVTKTPGVFSPIDRKLITDDLKHYGIKNIFFSYLKYGCWVPVTPAAIEQKHHKAKTIFLITGIANPTPLSEYLKRICSELHIYRFPDHYQFSRQDMKNIVNNFREMYSGNKVVITTEKDAIRMRSPELQEIIKDIPLYYLPIEVEFHGNEKDRFNELILRYVKKNLPSFK